MEKRLRTIVRLQPVLVAMLLSAASTPGSAGIFSKNLPLPDWAIEANKTKTPDYARSLLVGKENRLGAFYATH